MKSEELILANLNQKLGAHIAGFNTSERIEEHIRMLDWVLTDGQIRGLDDIIKERGCGND